MKVKLDFITNSSSTCYMVCLPLTLKPIKPLEVLNEWDYDGSTEIEALEIVTKGIAQLQNGESLLSSEDKMFWSIRNYLHENGFVLTSIETSGGGGYDIIQPIEIEKIEEFLKRHKQYETETRLHNKQ